MTAGVSEITVSDLVTTGGIGQVHLTWTNGVDACLSYQQRLVVEVWASETNDRGAAVKIGESAGNSYVHTGTPGVGLSLTTRYYWVRVRNVLGQNGPWHPESSTAGVSGVPSQANAPYIDITEGVVDVGSTPGRVIVDGDNKRFTVNDGTRDRVRMGDTDGAGAYGITIYDASGNVILSSASGPGAGFSLPSGQVSGLGSFATLSQINSGNASTYIASAAIGSAQVGTLTAGNISVSSLSALSANLGTVTAGSMSAVSISGATITGGTYSNSSSNALPFYISHSNSGGAGVEVIASGTNATGVNSNVAGGSGIGVYGGASGGSGIGVSANAGNTASTALALLARSGSAITSQAVVTLDAQSSSYASTMLNVNCARSATSSFQFAAFRSGGGSDNEFRLDGDGNAYADGAWTGGGAGIAHWLESETGETMQLGTTVVFGEGDNIRAATPDDNPALILGVVAPPESCAVLANAGWNRWTNKYLVDDFGAHLFEEYPVWRWQEEITVPVYCWRDETGEWNRTQLSNMCPEGAKIRTIYRKQMEWRETENESEAPDGLTPTIQHRRALNPNYDPERKYTARAERPEWHAVKHRGRAAIRKGQPVNPRWRLLKEVSAQVSLWWVD